MKHDNLDMEMFEAACRPLISFMRKFCHPHTTVMVDSEGAQLMEGVMATRGEIVGVDAE